MARRGLASARPAGEKASADILACAVNYVITRNIGEYQRVVALSALF